MWSWDITKLMGPAKWSYFYLYVILAIYCRRVVGWCVADTESAVLFGPLFDNAISEHKGAARPADNARRSRWPDEGQACPCGDRGRPPFC